PRRPDRNGIAKLEGPSGLRYERRVGNHPDPERHGRHEPLRERRRAESVSDRAAPRPEACGPHDADPRAHVTPERPAYRSDFVHARTRRQPDRTDTLLSLT